MNKHWTDKSKGMNNLDDRIAGLSPAKRALIELRLKKKGFVVSGEQRIPKRQKHSPVPLSFAQQRLWFLNQLGTGSAYNIPMAIHLKGLPNIKALEESLNEIIRRHEALRTTFRSNDGRPVQVIADNMLLEMPLIDLSAKLRAEREAEAEQLTRDEAVRPFDLVKGPLFRAALIRLSEKEHILLLTMHHIVSDGWSMGIFTAELTALYKAFCNGEASPLPELPIQYADFAHWQREWLRGEILENQLSYWRKQLEGVPVLQLPTDRPRPAVQTHGGAIETLALSKELTDALRAISLREGVTLFMTLLAAFNMLLYRHTGQEDIVVGSPIANRNRVEIEGLIGFFVNSLVMRTDLSGNPTFSELMHRVQTVALEAYEHQDIPFEKLVEELNPERDMRHTPLFQVMFNMINVRDIEVELHNLSGERMSSKESESKFDMTLYVLEGEGGIKLRFLYNTDLFDASTISWMLAHFETLLKGIADDPDQYISALPLLTENTKRKLSTKGNTIQPTKSFADIKAAEIDQSLQGRFMQRVQSYPDNIAVKTRKYEWTYQELNLEANRIAKRILTECGEKEERIALLFGHDAPMIASLFSVLKAGKAYVPLDPSYPVERLAYILEDSNACAVLTDSTNVDLAEALIRRKVQLINIDDKQSVQSSENVEVLITPDALAYILYTSGSTGLPKGVMQNHRNVMHFIRVYTNNLHISEDDRLTLISSYSFDGAIMDIFGALLNGSTLYPINIKEETAEDMLQWLIDQEITLYHSTPTVYRYFLSSLDVQKKFPKIRLVVLGGEEVFRRDVELYKKYFEPDSIFINGLGPSESTVTLQYFVNGNTEISRTAVPVGYPVEKTEILLLNEAGEEAEVYGEISIRSPHIALGYWQKPELTNKHFLLDPEGGDKRIYRSGDMGRLLPDGSIEFAGRKDFQVKIRGFRIEVGEIEVALAQHPATVESAVVPGEDSHGDRQLVAYLVINESPSPSVSEIRNFLNQKLPEYMIPSAFVFLDALPRTPSGKVDHRALPAPDLERFRLETKFVAPRTDVEKVLAKIWGEVLGLERVGVHDNFFELGGHSLLATRVVSRIQQEFHVDLKLMDFFKMPTIVELTKRIEGLLWINAGRPSDNEAELQDREEWVL
jgi:amino acid adenylation domain-containing protein